MFAVGCMLPPDEVQEVARRWRTVLGGTVLQYTAMPLLAFGAIRLVPFESPAVIGIAMVGCVPGAMASNVLTMIGRGNVSYSVSLTTASTLLSPIAVPVALHLTLHASVRLDLTNVAMQLVLMVVGPVILGFLVCRLSGRLRAAMGKLGPVVANATILWIIAVVVAANRPNLAAANGVVVLALLAINLLGYAAGAVGARVLRLTKPMRRALVLEIGMQNAGLGTTLVLQFFPDQPTAAIPTALYTFGCMFTGTILAHWWARCDRQAVVATPNVVGSVVDP
jgi:BASS family bile acid:Na+ symporter